MSLEVLKTELTTDPLGPGGRPGGQPYASMSNLEVADELNTKYRTASRETLEAWEVYEAIDQTEWDALSDAEKAKGQVLLDMGAVKARQPSRAVTAIVAVFGAGSQTITNLKALRDTAISRGVEIGYGHVKVGHVAEARL